MRQIARQRQCAAERGKLDEGREGKADKFERDRADNGVEDLDDCMMGVAQHCDAVENS